MYGYKKEALGPLHTSSYRVFSTKLFFEKSRPAGGSRLWRSGVFDFYGPYRA